MRVSALSGPITSPRRLYNASRAGSEALMDRGLSTRPGCFNPLDLACRHTTDRIPAIGTWRSLVARSVRDAEVAGSNPAVPTTKVLVRDL